MSKLAYRYIHCTVSSPAPDTTLPFHRGALFFSNSRGQHKQISLTTVLHVLCKTCVFACAEVTATMLEPYVIAKALRLIFRALTCHFSGVLGSFFNGLIQNSKYIDKPHDLLHY